MTDIETLAISALRRCGRVSAGIDELLPMLTTTLPYGGQDLADLDVGTRTAALAFLKRFEQLQDLVGRLARATIGWEGGDARDLTQRDLGNWLEKRGLVVDAITWLAASRLRNRLVHEYPLEEDEQVARLNESWTLMPALRDAACRLDDYLALKGLPR